MSLEPTDPDQLVRDLQMTPRWIVMSLKEARQQAAEEKAVRERLEHESAGLRASTDDYVKRGQATEARLALLTSEFLEYSKQIESWKTKFIKASQDHADELSGLLQASQQEAAGLRGELGHREAAIGSLRSDLQRAAQQYHDYVASAGSQTAAAEELQKVVAEKLQLQQQIEVARDFFAALQQQQSEKSATIQALMAARDESIERLRQQVDDLTLELERTNRELRSQIAARSHSQQQQQQRERELQLERQEQVQQQHFPVRKVSSVEREGSFSARGSNFEALVEAVQRQEKDCLAAVDMGLAEVPAVLFRLTWLYKVDLSSNCLVEVPEGFSGLPMLEELTLSNNRLAAFPHFRGDRLAVLEMAGNLLFAVPEQALARFPRLQVLDLSRNQLEALPEGLELLNGLQILNAAYNRLTSLPSSIGRCGALTELNLATNQLPQLPPDIALLSSLVFLDVSNNMLRALPDTFLGLEGSLQDVRLHGNPWEDSQLERAAVGPTSLFQHLRGATGAPSHKRHSLRQPLLVGEAEEQASSPLLPSSKDATSLLRQHGGLQFSGTQQPSLPSSLTTSISASSTGLLSASPSLLSSSPSAGLIVPTKTWREEELSGAAVVKQEDIAVKQKDDYELFFFNTPHCNFLSEEQKSLKTSCAVVVSISQAPHDNCYRALIRTQNKDETVFIPAEAVKKHSKATLARDKDLLRALQEHQCQGLRFRSVGTGVSDLLFSLGEELTTNSFKIGVLFVASGQTAENHFYSNQDGGKRFDQFLGILGEKIHLEGWSHYAGGLDTVGGATGQHSYYCRSESMEFMFHVSTLLPYFPADEQQIERKRHLGNDIVVFVFVDDDRTPFTPESLTSVFNHVYVVVHVLETDPVSTLATRYQLTILSKPGVDKSLPLLPSPPVFPADRGIRDFLLFKAINLERAAYAAPGFAPAIRRTRRDLISTLCSSILPSAGTSTPRGAILTTPSTPQRRRMLTKIFGPT